MFHAVYEVASGKLVSVTTILPKELPDGLASAKLGAKKPDWSVKQWDETSKKMTARPERPPKVDRVASLDTLPSLAKLTPAERSALKEEVGRLLGDRYE